MQRSYEASLVPGLQDSRARIADMDAAGVAAAVIFHGGLNGQSIPFSTTGLIAWGDTRYNHLEPAGVRIYNRWLADFVSEAPDRHIGIAHIPISDPEACVREVEWAAESGPEGHQPAGAARRLPDAQRPGVGAALGGVRGDRAVAQHPRRRRRALPVRGRRAPRRCT